VSLETNEECSQMTDLSRSTRILASGFAMGESARWHNNCFWLSDWGTQEIIALNLDRNRESRLAVPFAFPFCFDWQRDDRLLVVSGREARLLKQDGTHSLMPFADLSAISTNPWNEIVVDGRGNAYINSGEAIALVTPEGSVRKVAEGGQFPNGMAVTADNGTLLLAESHAKQLTAFDISSDGSLSNRRSWAELNGPPDGICLDAEGAVWYADVPNKQCVRVREGGEILLTVEVDRGCFSCALGGPNGRTLFIVATEWRGMEKIAEVAAARTSQVLTFTAPAPAADRGARP
jgi:sugar lactone lactonase YvrE